MRELNAILYAWAGPCRHSGVLATIVHVEGSAYRRPGARMLIGDDGLRIGSISGGCLEGEVVRKAGWWTSQGDPVIRVFDTSSPDDTAWEFGLGCNGVVHVLLERVESPGTRAFLAHLAEAQRLGEGRVVATVVRSGPGTFYRIGDHMFGEDLNRGSLGCHAEEARVLRKSRLVHLQHGTFFVEYIPPRQELVIFGAGHDVVPVAAQGAALGWNVTVADVRSGYVKPERFPGAQRVLLLPSSGDLSALSIGADTAVIVMTHNFSLDLKLLPQLVPLGPAYLGLLGPRSRQSQLWKELGWPDCFGDRLFSPAGLDLGGDAPESIALAIVAEIQATLHGRSARPLRHRRESIHLPADEVGDRSRFEVLETLVPVCEVTAVA